MKMKERLLESLAILLAGLFSAERPRPWHLGDAAPKPYGAAPNEDAESSAAKRSKN
jgi:hypothetical protein